MSLNLSSLQLAPQEPLRQCSRQNCSQCGKSSSFYCCDCSLNLLPGTPQLRLPVKVDIVQHGETNSRGTGIHAALLAPHDVTLYRHESGNGHHRKQDPLSLHLPDYPPEATVVLFPEDKDTDVVGSCAPFERVVVLDGSWRKARAMLQHPSLRGLRRVQLPTSVRTVFWRRGAGEFRGAVDEGVSTIEAIHWLCSSLDPGTCFDNLLWYFTHMHSLVQQKGGPPQTRTKQPSQKSSQASPHPSQ